MIFYSINLMLVAMLFFASLGWAASDDIENRFIYSDYSKKISMDFKDVSLIDVLKIFSKQSGSNFIAEGDVSGKRVTVYFRNIPIEEALDKILETNDLTYEVSPNSDVFVVKAKDKEQLITKVFPLKYASVTSAAIMAAQKGTKGGITDTVKSILSKEGKLQEDPRTNSFIITDTPKIFPLIEEMINKLDVPVAQILIQVEMLDVSKSASQQIGISYGNGNPFVTVTGGTRSATFPFSESLIASKTGTSPVSWTNGSYDFTGMTAALDFLKSQTDTRSLARPKILTLNNQKAEIKIETNEAIGLSSVTASTSSSSNGQLTTGTASAERAKTGVSLEVTPQANVLTGEITMLVKPKVADATGTTSFGTVATTFHNPEERSSESILKVKSGETFIIGGLLITQDQNVSSKVPVLGDIPMVGGVFRHKNTQKNERELIIFITPYILNDNIKNKMESEAKVRLNREVGDSHSLDPVSQQLNYTEMGK